MNVLLTSTDYQGDKL